MNPQIYYKFKTNYDTFSDKDLRLLARYFDISVKNRNDLTWQLAINTVSSKYAQMLPKESREFNEYFSEIRTLGKGSFGVVILTTIIKEYNGIKPGSLVAIKLLPMDNNELIYEANKEELIYEATKEVQILQNLSNITEKCNVGIVCYYGSGVFTKDGIQYFAIITEYIKGITLKEFIDKEVPHTIQIDTGKSEYDLVEEFSNENITQLMKKLAETLKYIHERDVVHRDIKLTNIMVPTTGGILKYIDFGTSCFTDIKNEFACKKDNSLIGTLRYVSPELWLLYRETMGYKTMSLEEVIEVYKRGDVWALGIVFYVFIFGNLPIELKGSITALQSFLSNDRKITFDTNFRGDPKLIEIIRGMLTKDIHRQSTISQVVSEFNNI